MTKNCSRGRSSTKNSSRERREAAIAAVLMVTWIVAVNLAKEYVT